MQTTQSDPIESIVLAVEDKLKEAGNAAFVSTNILLELGLFSTPAAIAKAIRENKLPAIQVSPHRSVIPRTAIVDFIRQNLSQKR